MRIDLLSSLTVAIMLATTPGWAQGGQTAPATSQTSARPPSAPGAPRHYTVEATTIGDLLADPAAKAVVDRYIPGFSTAPGIEMASGMTLTTVQQMSPDKVSEKQVDDINADLAKLPPK